MKPEQFVAKWSQIQQKETAVSQSHFNDISHPLSDEEILEHLLALNLERAAPRKNKGDAGERRLGKKGDASARRLYGWDCDFRPIEVSLLGR